MDTIEKRNTCFIIMPFGGDFDDYYLQIYKPAVEAVGLKSLRADDLYRPSTIISDIWEMINSSKIMIADLSTLNANVMYELGLAHAVAKPVILISDSIDTIPFDLRGLRILTYNKNKPNWNVQLSDAIKNAIIETIEAPLESILPTFLKIRPSKVIEVNEITNDLLEIKQLLHQQFNIASFSGSIAKNKTLNLTDFTNAIKDCQRLYYDEGYEIADIKENIMNSYHISYNTASSIFEKALR
jgi:hypothetical protein